MEKKWKINSKSIPKTPFEKSNTYDDEKKLLKKIIYKQDGKIVTYQKYFIFMNRPNTRTNTHIYKRHFQLVWLLNYKTTVKL